MHIARGKSADEVWRSAANHLLDPEQSSPQESRNGNTIEALRVVLQSDDPAQRWVISRTPPINPAFAMIEVLWIVAGRRDAALPNCWNPALPRYCGRTEYYHGAYGYRLRHQLGFDQLARVYQALSSAPDSRQCVLQIWDGTVDLPNEDGTAASPDIPCNVMALPKIRNGKLEWLQIIRSSDLFVGVPHNIVQFSSLQEILSGWLGVSAGPYVQLSDSLHVYERDLDSIRHSLTEVPAPKSTDSFSLDYKTWHKMIPDVMGRLAVLMRPDLGENDLTAVAFVHDAPEAYDNSVLIAAADIARRHKWHHIADECSNRCSNPALRFIWKRWQSRCDLAASSPGRSEVPFV